jgi:hypothetical protein
MRASARQNAATLALTCALVLAATAEAFAPAGAGAAGTLAQYCVPRHDNMDLQRIFCREPG